MSPSTCVCVATDAITLTGYEPNLDRCYCSADSGSVANSSDFTIAFDVEVPSSLVGTKEILDLVMRAKVVWFQPLNPERFLLVDQGYWSNHLFLLDLIKLGYFIK